MVHTFNFCKTILYMSSLQACKRDPSVPTRGRNLSAVHARIFCCLLCAPYVHRTDWPQPNVSPARTSTYCMFTVCTVPGTRRARKKSGILQACIASIPIQIYNFDAGLLRILQSRITKSPNTIEEYTLP
jgi:hypothetical protein